MQRSRVQASAFRTIDWTGGGSAVPFHVHSDELLPAVPADIFTYVSYHNLLLLVTFSHSAHGVICDGDHGPDRDESYSRNLRCLRDVRIPEEVNPFFIRIDPLLFAILSIVKKLFDLFASFLLYARQSARTFKNPSGMMQNYVVLLLNSGRNKKILKVAIKINKMNQRGLDNGGGIFTFAVSDWI